MKDTKCNCAYCQEGMSKSAEECVDRLAEDAKSLKEEKADWKPMFRKMYPWYKGK